MTAILLSLMSCDCLIKAEGVILDKETRQPVEDVEIAMFYKDGTAELNTPVELSDKNGHFRFSKVTGTLCDFKLSLGKKGYITQQRAFPPNSDGDTIFLQKHLDFPF